jgi:hypothetical protein
MRAVLCLGVLAWLMLPASAQAPSAGQLDLGQDKLGQQQAPDQRPADVALPSIQAHGDRDKTCLEWNDGCRTCRRDTAAVRCSNIGIACQPTQISCTRRQDALPKDASPKDVQPDSAQTKDAQPRDGAPSAQPGAQPK